MHDGPVGPLISPDSVDLSPVAIVASVAVGIAVVLIAVVARRFLLAAVDELVAMGRGVGGRIAAALLRRRPGEVRVDPWFCARCRSQNSAWAVRCYSCDARRDDAEAPVPDADVPAGPSAGRAQRRG